MSQQSEDEEREERIHREIIMDSNGSDEWANITHVWSAKRFLVPILLLTRWVKRGFVLSMDQASLRYVGSWYDCRGTARPGESASRLGNVHTLYVSGRTVLTHQIVIRAITGDPTSNACGRSPNNLGIVTSIRPVPCIGGIRERTRLEVLLFRASVDGGLPPEIDHLRWSKASCRSLRNIFSNSRRSTVLKCARGCQVICPALSTSSQIT